jgi:DNA-nicking Smr family endonuclease
MTKKAPERALSPDEAALWRHVAGTAKPLKKSDKPKTGPAAVAAPRSRPAPRPAPLPPKPAALPELAPGAAPGVDKRTVQRLKKGEIPIEATLDLHGLTQDEAHAALARFVGRCTSAGKRGVIVVTGKGLRAGGTGGILRANVPRWLNEPELRAHVLAFARARPKDGGEGALYVLLKKRRA